MPVRTLTAPAVVALAACASMQQGTGALEPCDAQHLAVLVGEPTEKLEDVPLPEPTRIVAPGDAVTMDHRPERLTVLAADGGPIYGMRCG
jgi:hypothetical protein